jgi:hypothetical protein
MRSPTSRIPGSAPAWREGRACGRRHLGQLVQIHRQSRGLRVGLAFYAGDSQANANMPQSTHDLVPVRRALLSVSDKSGLADFAKALHHEFGVELISTGVKEKGTSLFV